MGDLGCVLAALVLGGLATDATEVASGSYAATNELIGLVAAVALWWRRRAPLMVAAITFLAGALAPMAGGAAIVSVYTVAAHRRLRVSSGVAALYVLYLVSGAVSVTVFRDEDLGVVGGALAGALLTVAAYGWGLAVRSRRELVEALAETVERAEAEQQARIAEARRAERARIAAEMHDVLAHRLSLLSLHAGAIELHPDARHEDLAAAAGVVRASAHLALDDLRAIIGVLRDGSPGDLAPQPTIADLGALVGECRTAGMSLEVVDTLPVDPAVPAELGRHTYVVVREALTNARKHAPGQPVRLVVSGAVGSGLQIQVVNSVDLPGRGSADVPGAGVGLIGLRERVELAGGRLDHGIDDTGTHRVEAWLPWST